MKNLRNKIAVSQILSEIILLGIAIVSISIIYTQVLAVPGPQDITNVTIIGKIEEKQPVFELQRGESLTPDAKIYLKINGILQNPINQSLQTFIGLKNWMIGDRIIYPDNVTGDITNRPQVEATIIDSKTNAIVFWGILQKGLTTGYKGGIWLFDEKNWTGVPNEVKDSSGNNNHGIATNGSKIINGTSQPTNVVHNNAGYFDGINDYVEVRSSWTLNITDQITIGAWVKPLQERAIIETDKLDQKFGFTPFIIQLSDGDKSENNELYAIVSEWQSQKGLLSIYNISNDGNFEFTGNEWTFANSAGQKRNVLPVIMYISNEMYLITYQDKSDKLHAITLYISANGTIKSTSKETSFDNSASGSNRPSLIKISNETCAIVYRALNNSGTLRLININSSGTISLKNISYFSTSCFEPNIINVKNDIYAIIYRNEMGTGFVKTFNITSSGEIRNTGNFFSFDSCFEPDVINVSNETFVIVYHNNANQGALKTIKILSDGSISSQNHTLIFENTGQCHSPTIIQQSINLYSIVYSTNHPPGIGGSKGYFLTIEIFDNGTFGLIIQERTGFEDDTCFDSMAIKISNRIFAVVYEGKHLYPPNDHPGVLETILLKDTSPLFMRGIVRAGAATIYAEYPLGATNVTVFACLNGTQGTGTILTTTVTPNIWHHIALTYDGAYMRLYIDGNTSSKLTKSFSGALQLPNENFRFGNIFYGYLDEIVIFDKAYESIDIQTQKNHPEYLTNYL